jgi:hypothetical protein
MHIKPYDIPSFSQVKHDKSAFYYTKPQADLCKECGFSCDEFRHGLGIEEFKFFLIPTINSLPDKLVLESTMSAENIYEVIKDRFVYPVGINNIDTYQKVMDIIKHSETI